MGAAVFSAAPGGDQVDGTYVSPFFDGLPVGKVTRKQVTGSASYATGGETFTPAQVGLRNVNRILVEPGANLAASQPGNSVCLAGTPQAPLLKFFNAATGGGGAVAEVTAAQSLVDQPVIIWFIGD